MLTAFETNLPIVVISVLQVLAMVSASSMDVYTRFRESGLLPLLDHHESLHLQSEGTSNLEKPLMREEASEKDGSQMQRILDEVLIRRIWASHDSDQGQNDLLASENVPRDGSRTKDLQTPAHNATCQDSVKTIDALGATTFLLGVPIWPGARAASLFFLFLLLIVWSEDASCADTPSSCFEDESESVVDASRQDLFDFACYESVACRAEALDTMMQSDYGVVKNIDSLPEPRHM